MCGRYALSAPKQRIVQDFLVREWFEDEEAALGGWRPNRDIRPTNTVPVIRMTAQGRCLELMRWGFLLGPGKPKRQLCTWNTVSEKAAHSPLWGRSGHGAIHQRRCLIPAEAFFEWQVVAMTLPGPRGGKPKAITLKHVIRRADEQLFAFAGIWESRPGPEGHAVNCCSILTVEANALMAWVHNRAARMPAILETSQFDEWCDPVQTDYDKVRPLLRPCPDGLLFAEPVERKDPGGPAQQSLF